MLRTLALALAVAAGCVSVANAQCAGAGGVPFNCQSGSTPPGAADLFLGGSASGNNTVKWTGLQTAQGVFGQVPTLSGGGTTNFLRADGTWAVPAGGGGGGSGTVTSTSVATANGFSGTVANPTTTPVITLGTTITGLLKGNGTAISVAIPGTDYVVTNPLPALTQAAQNSVAFRGAINAIGDGINAADSGVVADGQEGWFGVTRSGNTINFSKSGTAYQVTTVAGTNLLTLKTATGETPTFEPTDVGSCIFIPGGGVSGADLVSTIVSTFPGGVATTLSVTLADNLGVTWTNQPVALFWPCFRAGDVGKPIWVETGSATSADGVFLDNAPLATTITAVNSPISINTAIAPGGPQNAAHHTVWGTDNHAAILAARAATLGKNRRYINFENTAAPGVTPTGLIVASGWSFNSQIDADAQTIIWAGNGTRSFMWDTNGYPLYHRVTAYDRSTQALPVPRPTLDLRNQAPRFQAAAAPIVCEWGDSMSAESPTQSAGWSQTGMIRAYLSRNYPNKTLTWKNFGIGSTSWLQMLDLPFASGLPLWYVDHTKTWDFFVSAANCDLMLLEENGGNDGPGFSEEHAQAVINKIRNSFPKDGSSRAPDIVMVNSRPWSIGGSGSRDNLNYYGWARAAGINRTIASTQGFGFLDYHEQATLSRDGWGDQHTRMKMIPKLNGGSLTGGTPFSLGVWATGFDYTYGLSNNAQTFWSGVGRLDNQIGPAWGNLLKLWMDGSNKLNYQIDAWGQESASTVSVTAANPAVVTISGNSTASATSVTATPDFLTNTTSVVFGGVTTFAASDVGKTILIPNLVNRSASLAPIAASYWRTKIVKFTSTSTVVVQGYPPSNANQTISLAATVYWGPIMFLPVDAVANPNIQITGAGASGATLGQAAPCHIASITFPLSATLDCNNTAGTALTASAQTIFLGQTVAGPTQTPILLSGLTMNNGGPTLQVGIHGDQLQANYGPGLMKTTANVTIASGSPNLAVDTAMFSADMVGENISVPGAGAAGAALTSQIGAFTDSTHVVLTDNAATGLVASSQSVSTSFVGFLNIFTGIVRRGGGGFYPRITAQSSGQSFSVLGLGQSYIEEPNYYMPTLTDEEMWGTVDSFYTCGGTGVGHSNSCQSEMIDRVLLDAQRW